jgi:hypothetical protein
MLQAMREGLTYTEARAVAVAEENARTAAQAGNGMPQSVPPFREMMQRLDRVRPRCLAMLPSVPLTFCRTHGVKRCQFVAVQRSSSACLHTLELKL